MDPLQVIKGFMLVSGWLLSTFGGLTLTMVATMPILRDNILEGHLSVVNPSWPILVFGLVLTGGGLSLLYGRRIIRYARR